jgi:hypothetical protein
MKFRSPLIIVLALTLCGISLPVHAERLAPKPVKPVEKDGIEYSAPVDKMGHVVATWNKTSSVIWNKQIYLVKFDYRNNALEQDVQSCFITNLRLDGNKLIITNELGYEYSLELDSVSVKVLKGQSVIDISNPH